MTAKRFRVNDLVKYNYSEIGEYIDENHTDRPLRNDEVVELLNEQHETIQRLKQNIDELMQLDVEEDLLKENEQLRKDATTLIYVNKDYREEIKFLKNKVKIYKVANQLLKESLDKEWK